MVFSFNIVNQGKIIAYGCCWSVQTTRSVQTEQAVPGLSKTKVPSSHLSLTLHMVLIYHLQTSFQRHWRKDSILQNFRTCCHDHPKKKPQEITPNNLGRHKDSIWISQQNVLLNIVNSLWVRKDKEQQPYLEFCAVSQADPALVASWKSSWAGVTGEQKRWLCWQRYNLAWLIITTH